MSRSRYLFFLNTKFLIWIWIYHKTSRSLYYRASYPLLISWNKKRSDKFKINQISYTRYKELQGSHELEWNIVKVSWVFLLQKFNDWRKRRDNRWLNVWKINSDYGRLNNSKNHGDSRRLINRKTHCVNSRLNNNKTHCVNSRLNNHKTHCVNSRLNNNKTHCVNIGLQQQESHSKSSRFNISRILQDKQLDLSSRLDSERIKTETLLSYILRKKQLTTYASVCKWLFLLLSPTIYTIHIIM